MNNVAPTACPSGSYNLLASTSACITCPGGYYCDDPTIAATPCASGKFEFKCEKTGLRFSDHVRHKLAVQPQKIDLKFWF